MEFITGIIAILSTFGSLVFFVYMHYTSKHRERMAMIEQGIDPFKYRYRARRREGLNLLKYGILLASFGLGLVGGFALELGGFPGEVAYFSMIFLFGGFGMVIYYYSQRKRSREPDMLAEEV